MADRTRRNITASATPRRRRRGVLLLGCVICAGWLGGCGGATADGPVKRSGTSVIVIDRPPAKPRLSFGALTLLMSRADVRALRARPGWSGGGAVPEDGAVRLTPPASDAATRYDVRLERGRVIQLKVTYRQARAERAAMRHGYARSKIQADGTWAMTDALRATLVLLRVGGASLVATHLAATRDKTGAKAMLERYLGE